MSANIFDKLLLSPTTYKPMPENDYRYYHCVKEDGKEAYNCRLVTTTQKLVPVHPSIPRDWDPMMVGQFLGAPVKFVK